MPLSKIPMPIDWSFAMRELAGEMKPSYTNGQGAIGVNNGGKHSVDVTYIAAAEATGKVDVRTLHQVSDVERAKDGRWVVYVDRIDTTGAVVENKILKTDTLIMAAGSVNTTKLLVRARETGRIPDLPEAVGEGWGSNADRIYVWTSLEDDFGDKQGGPVVYGSLNWDDPASAHTVIQASMPPMQFDARSTMLVAYGVSESRGRFVYDPAQRQAVLRWPKDGDVRIQNGHIDPAVRRIAGPRSILIDTNSVLNSTWHPLGGACMADSAEHGVVNADRSDGAAHRTAGHGNAGGVSGQA